MLSQHYKKVEEVKAKLRARLDEGVHRPGDRFLSTRALASTFGISYQSAHRVSQELCDEGLLERRATSGTYIPGGHKKYSHVQFIFNERARRPQSFGARLLEELTHKLGPELGAWEVTWTGGPAAGEPLEIAPKGFPVIWESPEAMAHCYEQRRAGLLLNDRPQPGLQATFLDSVSIDDYSGGACAAQLLTREPAGNSARPASLAVLSGPVNDPRSNNRRDGFLSIIPGAYLVASRGWFFEEGYAVAAAAVKKGEDGLFCCNDRLAEAVIAYCRDYGVKLPRLVGFDDAPVAELLDLTTIAIPWDEMVAGALDLVKKRLGGDSSTARQLILTPRPIIRKL